MAIGIGTPTTCEGCGASVVAASHWDGPLGRQLVRWWIEWPLAEGSAEDDAAIYDVPKSAIVAHTLERCSEFRANRSRELGR